MQYARPWASRDHPYRSLRPSTQDRVRDADRLLSFRRSIGSGEGCGPLPSRTLTLARPRRPTVAHEPAGHTRLTAGRVERERLHAHAQRAIPLRVRLRDVERHAGEAPPPHLRHSGRHLGDATEEAEGRTLDDGRALTGTLGNLRRVERGKVIARPRERAEWGVEVTRRAEEPDAGQRLALRVQTSQPRECVADVRAGAVNVEGCGGQASALFRHSALQGEPVAAVGGAPVRGIAVHDGRPAPPVVTLTGPRDAGEGAPEAFARDGAGEARVAGGKVARNTRQDDGFMLRAVRGRRGGSERDGGRGAKRSGDKTGRRHRVTSEWREHYSRAGLPLDGSGDRCPCNARGER